MYLPLQIANSGKQVITIPPCIALGQYLLRPELIALHGGKDTIHLGPDVKFLTCLQHQIPEKLNSM
jgi:hypothetical protein